MKRLMVADLSDLPTSGFGASSPMWWGTLAFCALEGTGFALAISMYLFLASIAPQWPNGAPLPDLGPGSLVTALLLVSAVPNRFVKRWAVARDPVKTRWGLVAMSLFGLAPLVVRWFEFPALRVLWDANAYGSVVWLLLGLHTTHLITDVGDTIVLTALMFTRHGEVPRRFSDVADNAFYWDFVVLSWLPIYLLVYWAPRF